MLKLAKSFHNLSIRYKLFIPLLVVMLIIIASQFLMRGFNNKSIEETNNWINIAGRNRSLSIKILSLSQQIIHGDQSAKKELNTIIAQLETALRTLQLGGEVVFNNKVVHLKPVESSILPLFNTLQKDWQAYQDQILKINTESFRKYTPAQQRVIIQKAVTANEKFIGTSNFIIEKVNLTNRASQQKVAEMRRLVILSNVFILLLVIYIFWKYAFRPLHKLSEVANNMVLGNLEEVLDIDQKDEIGRIANATAELAYNLKEVKTFVRHLGQGNYDVQLEMETKNRMIAEGSLFMTLVVARDRLRQLMVENQKQTWASHGLAEFGDTLSAGDTDLKDLTSTVISQLVKYMNGNQGGLFLLNEIKETADKSAQKQLELVSCYGYSEKRRKNRKILLDDDFGGGLLGQALIEKGTIHQVKVPADYFEVSLGMDEITNGNILIVPLISNQIEIGVLEIGSFIEFENHQIEFVENLADRIASTILNIQAGVKTTYLLMEAEEQKDILQAQEEEMRQNVEELRSIHEVMEKKQKELELQNQRIKSSELVLKKALKQLGEQKIELEETNEILHAQEEEMRQNVEELISTQEALALKSKNLEHQNKFITTSIYYAQNIQQAILPSREDLLSLLKGGFVIYRPKDIVSGDFYWLSRVEEKVIVAAVDCTGHGVPGAFMSMIGNTLLNQIINEKKATDPADILRLLDKSIYEDLNQQKTSNREGMDVCLCVIEYEEDKAKVMYGGAKRGLYYYHQNNLEELKGDRFSIGGWQSYTEKYFTSKELILDVGDRLYLSSDGFVDTPNPKRKSMGTKRLRQILQTSASLSMNEQQTAVENALNNFQQDAEQRDDILLIGVEL